MIFMQRNNNFSLLTAQVGFPESGKKNTYFHEKRGSFFYATIKAYSLSVAKSVYCGYLPIRKHLILELKADRSMKIDHSYSKRIRTRIHANIIEFAFKKFAKEDEGVVQCLMTPDYYSKKLHLILIGECIYLLICPFKCALAGTMCL